MTPTVLIYLAAFLSVMIPAVFVTIRESVKTQRREIIRDLEIIFTPDATAGETPIQSFEFVKLKYFLESEIGGNSRKTFDDFHHHYWIISSIPLILLLFLTKIIVLAIVAHAAFGVEFAWGIAWLRADIAIPTFGWIFVAAFAGAYIFMLKAFFTAINNFDLSPFSFVGAFINLLMGLVLSFILIYGVLRLAGGVIGGPTDPPNSAVFAIILGTAFAVGYYPSIANRDILGASQLQAYKKENQDLYKSFTAVPIDIIDGIDTEIRDRLSDFHIGAVQNLAAVNPLMLFVETPYGVYQIIDWVAQAQLCCSVGPSTLLKLWPLGIRTIFDLERAALEPVCMNEGLLMLIGKALMAGADPTPDQATIIADIRLRLNDSHVLRLRQLYNRIGDKLGPGSTRLPPILECSMKPDGPCPFARSKKADDSNKTGQAPNGNGKSEAPPPP